jgi:hypothetical protein
VEVERARVEPPGGLAGASRVEITREFRIEIEELDRAAASLWHAVSFPELTSSQLSGGP